MLDNKFYYGQDGYMCCDIEHVKTCVVIEHLSMSVADNNKPSNPNNKC